MIESITIADIATYSSTPQMLDGLSKFTYIFGANATGKTIISRVIANEDAFPSCIVAWRGGTRLQPMVYNQDFVEHNFNQPVHHPAWLYKQLREAVCGYWKASRDLARAKNRLKAFYLFNGVQCEGKRVYSKRDRKRYAEQLKSRSGNLMILELSYQDLDSCRERKAGYLRVLRKSAESLREQMTLLRTIPGIGLIAGYTLLAYLEDGWRISNKRKLWRYCGLSIRKHETDGKGRQGASRKGNRYLKNVLMTAVSSLASKNNRDNALAKRWQAALAGGTDPDRMRRNQARTIAVIIQHILRLKERYQDERVTTAH